MAQDALDHLFKISLALAQVFVFHVVELACDDFVLRGQRPFSVVMTLVDPVLDTTDQLLVLQQHQVHIKQGRDFMGHIFRQIIAYPNDFLYHRIAGNPDTRDLFSCMGGINKVVRYIAPA